MTKKIYIEYYAILREERGLDKETIETQVSTAKDVYYQLKKEYGFSFDIKSLQLAINDEFSQWNKTIKSGDRLIFIPPVAGG